MGCLSIKHISQHVNQQAEERQTMRHPHESQNYLGKYTTASLSYSHTHTTIICRFLRTGMFSVQF